MAAVMQELENTNSFPYMEREVTLITKPAQEVYKRVFKTLSRAHVNIGVVIRVKSEIDKHSEIELADKAEETLRELYTQLREDITKEDAMLKKLLEDNGVTDLVKYTSEKTVKAPIQSPEDNQYLALLAGLDDLVAKFDTLWMSGLFTSKQKVVSTMEWKRRLVKHSARIIDLSNKMRARMRKDQDSATETPSERSDDVENNLSTIENADDKDKSEPELIEPEKVAAVG